VGLLTCLSQGQGKPSEELNLMIDDLLNDLSNKFMGVAAEITAKSMYTIYTVYLRQARVRVNDG
jgi:hypothetical protein